MAITQSELRDLLTEYRRENWLGIQTPEWQQRIVESMIGPVGVEPHVLQRIAPYWKMPPDAKILDVGSGVGGFVVACRQRGLRAFGIEPDRIGQGSQLTSVQIARRRLDDAAFVVGIGEQLPFPDDAFDLVVLDQVIEHVMDQAAVLREALRVIKAGGLVYIACPNYLRFYEPHYKILWFPLMPKWLGRFYLRLRGRNPAMLGQLNYTTNWRVHALIRRLDAGRAADLNRERFLKKCSEGGFASMRARLVSGLIRTPVLGGIILNAALFYFRLREGGSETIIFPRKRSTV